MNENRELNLFYQNFREDFGGALKRVDIYSEKKSNGGFINDPQQVLLNNISQAVNRDIKSYHHEIPVT